MAKFEAFRWNFSSSTNPEIGRSKKIVVHSSEIRGLRSTKCTSETLQSLLYFIYKKLENPCSFFRFSFHATFYFYLMNALVYVVIDTHRHNFIE